MLLLGIFRLLVAVAAVALVAANRKGVKARKSVEEFLSGSGSDDSVARAIEASWDVTAEQYYQDLGQGLGEDLAGAFRQTYLEVLAAKSLDDRQYVALVRVHFRGGQDNFLLEVMMPLFGCEPYWPEGMTLHPDYFSNRVLPNGLIRILCAFEDGKWIFKSREGEPKFIPLEDLEDLLSGNLAQQGPLGIGQPVLLEYHYKEPPFAVTVLGPPGLADQETVRLPIRITSVIPKWDYSHGGSIGAMLRTAEDADGQFEEWSSIRMNHILSGKDAPEDPFKGLILIQGGSYEDYLYFEPCDEAHVVTDPANTFVELLFLDEATEGEGIDLRKVTAADSRAVFNDGRPAATTLPANLKERVAELGSFWSDLPVPVPALLGDSVTLLDQADGVPFIELMALGEPERGEGISIRVPVRVVARYDTEPRSYEVEAQLSTPPGTHGRIRHVFEAMSFHRGSQSPADAINLEGMVMGEAREGLLYFAPYDEQGYTEFPDEPFTLLWYGPHALELPMDLTAIR